MPKRRGRKLYDDTRALAHMALLFVSGRTKSVRELADLSKHLAAAGASLPSTVDRLRGKYKKDRERLEAMARDARMSPFEANLQESNRTNQERITKLFEAQSKAAAASIDRWLTKAVLGSGLKSPTVEESLEVMCKNLKKGED